MDGTDAFDPESGAAAGIDMRRLLWVRCRNLDQVLRSTDLLLQGGGFGAVALDLSDLPQQAVRGVPLAVWFRFQRVLENTPTVLLLIGRESAAKSAAAVVLRANLRKAAWDGGLTSAPISRIAAGPNASGCRSPANPAFSMPLSKSSSRCSPVFMFLMRARPLPRSAALLDFASAFSPRVEDTAAGTVVLDIEGLDRLFGSTAELGQRLQDYASTLGTAIHVGIASNPDAAVCAARGWPGITILERKTEAARLKDLDIASAASGS